MFRMMVVALALPSVPTNRFDYQCATACRFSRGGIGFGIEDGIRTAPTLGYSGDAVEGRLSEKLFRAFVFGQHLEAKGYSLARPGGMVDARFGRFPKQRNSSRRK